MNTLLIILLVLTSGAILSYLAFKVSPVLGNAIVVLASFGAAIVYFTNYGTLESVEYSLGGIQGKLAFTPFSNLFAALVLVLSPLAFLYSISYMKGKDRLGTFYFSFFLSVLGMVGIVMSQDLISLFIFWEIMTWSSYLLVIFLGKDVEKVGVKYMVFSAIGAYSMFMAIVIFNRDVGSMMLEDIFINFSTLVSNDQVLLSVLLLIGFGIKSALMPLHVWAPGAYSNSPMAYTAVFSGALSKMGIFGLALVFVKLMPETYESIIREIVAWLGGITATMAAIYAVLQSDAKKMLAYSSVSQLGYIVLGLALGTEMSVMAAIFLAIIHAAFKGTLFMAVGAVERQAGSADMTYVTGLIRKMPFTFFSALISIIALAGIPPLAGFVGKWMLYEAMITSEHFFLVIIAFAASTIAFLYSFRILYSLFLGQEEPEFENVKEAPLPMIIPMVLMSIGLIVVGIFPGLLFDPIASGMQYLGFENLSWQMSTLVNPWGDSVDIQIVSMSLGSIFVLAGLFITFKGRKGTRYVGTKDIATSGEVPLDTDNLNHSLNFYRPFERAISPVLKAKMDDIYTDFGNGLSSLFQFIRYIYTGNGQTYAIYVVIFITVLMLFKDQIFGV